VKEIAHRTFVSGDGLDVYELTGEGNNIHARQDTLVPGRLRRPSSVSSVSSVVELVLTTEDTADTEVVPVHCYA
jgi:hypothetical protein